MISWRQVAPVDAVLVTVGPGRAMIKGWAWYWVGILVTFLIVAAVIGNGREAWSIVLWANLALFGLLVLLVFGSWFLDVRGRRRDAHRDD